MNGIDFRLNGVVVSILVTPATPLLFVLRNQLDHKGTRLGCGEGNCGACTVTVDGVPTTACNFPVGSAKSRDIGTIEGIKAGGHPLIAAMIAHQAGQCGYCLPGIVTRAAALIDHGKTSREVIAALDANLCRCGVHRRIIAAIQETVAKRDQS